MALLFAVNMAVNSKFMIFDESDTFLDFENSQRMVEFLKEVSKSRKMQIILVSHKSNVFENSDSLVGVTFCDKYESSQGFSLDLREK